MYCPLHDDSKEASEDKTKCAREDALRDVQVNQNRPRDITVEAIRCEIGLHHGSISMKQLAKIFGMSKKSPIERQDRFRQVVRELCLWDTDPTLGRVLVLKKQTPQAVVVGERMHSMVKIKGWPFYTGAVGQVRCSATTRRGRDCRYVAESGKLFCPMHPNGSPKLKVSTEGNKRRTSECNHGSAQKRTRHAETIRPGCVPSGEIGGPGSQLDAEASQEQRALALDSGKPIATTDPTSSFGSETRCGSCEACQRERCGKCSLCKDYPDDLCLLRCCWQFGEETQASYLREIQNFSDTFNRQQDLEVGTRVYCYWKPTNVSIFMCIVADVVQVQ
jgi:hypothetical protein